MEHRDDLRPDELLEVVVEVPKGSRCKYEIDPASGELWLDRTLHTATRYPANYGFSPGTLAGDGDALDVLVLMDDELVPGCHLWARPVAVLEMTDQNGEDQKIIAVPLGDPRWVAVRDLTDLPPHVLSEIGHFFSVYKQLEPGKHTDVDAFSGRGRAVEIIEDARRRHSAHSGR